MAEKVSHKLKVISLSLIMSVSVCLFVAATGKRV